MTNYGGTNYLLRNSNEGTVYSYTEASGDTDTPVYDSLPETANDGDVIAVGNRKYKASLSSVIVEHNAYDVNTALFNKRINSSGEEKDLGGALLLDYAEVTYDIDFEVTIKGIVSLVKNYSSYIMIDYYDSSKTRIGQLSSGYMSGTLTSSDYAGEVPVTFKPFKIYNTTLDGIENTIYIRIKLGIATDGTTISTDDVEGLVVNFPAKNTTEIKTTWIDIGSYITPIEAGWNATEETYSIIDSLQTTGNNGESAVCSIDGYLYSYIKGADWMHMSKYNVPKLTVDEELSDASTNAVQNRVIVEHFNETNAKVKTNTDELAIIKERIGNIVTIPSWWEDAVTKCIAKIKALQLGRNWVTFPFFSDNHENIGYAGILIAKVMSECGIPYCFYGGDTIGSSYIADETTMIQQDKNFDNMMSCIPDGRFCRAVGNHDGFWKVSSTEKYGYERWQVYELFLREESLCQNKHFGEDGTYYYVEDIASKIRFIILNTNPQTQVGAGSEIIDSTQLEWLHNTALSLPTSDWAVVIISHCPISNHYHANVTNASEVISAVNASGVDIVGWFSGHVHRDRIYTYTSVNGTDNVRGDDGEPLGFTQVIITSDNTSIAYNNDDGTTSTTKHPIGNDDQSHAIDFITINRDIRTVNITRLGIGEDRNYTY